MFGLKGVARSVALATVVLFALSVPAGAVSVSFKGVAPEDAINGLDAVELSEGNRVKGQGRYTYVFRGLQWRFVNDANKQQFKANPDAYTQD
jgi:YHS domain-containing protein